MNRGRFRCFIDSISCYIACTNYEQGFREIPLDLAVRLSKLYNVSLDYIVGLTNEPKSLK